MKTEAEIRAYRDALLKLADGPCSCAGTDHELACVTGAIMMHDAAWTLSWVLGDRGGQGMDARVSRIVNQAASQPPR